LIEYHLDRNSRLRKVARLIPVGIWFVLVTYLSLVSGRYLRSSWLSSIPYQDKVIHMGVYFVAAVLMMYGIGGRGGRTFLTGVVYTLIFCIMWGGMLEYLQDVMSRGRHFEIFDIIANIIGAFLGVVAFSLLLKKRYYGS